MKQLVYVIFLAAVAYSARDFLKTRAVANGTAQAPGLAYADTTGAYHSLSAPDKPAVFVLWVTPCPYCKRSLNVLDSLRNDYKPEDLDVVGLYLNSADNAGVDSIARGEGHSITMARGQPTGEFVQSLTRGLNFRAPGRDIYILGKNGQYQTVDASDLSTPDSLIYGRVRAILRDKHGLKDRG
jgi:hypothetical protein